MVAFGHDESEVLKQLFAGASVDQLNDPSASPSHAVPVMAIATATATAITTATATAVVATTSTAVVATTSTATAFDDVDPEFDPSLAH